MQVFVANVISTSFPQNTLGKTGVNITFFEEDTLDINLHNDDPLVITVQHGN